MNVYIVYNDESQIKELGGVSLKTSPFFTFINENTKSGKKEAYALKSHWGSKLTPFAVCYDKDKPIKAFYSEADENIIKSLINYLNDIHS